MSKKKQKDWVNNMISFTNSGDSGTCPFCGSSQVTAHIMDIGRGSLNFKCASCGKFAHIDGFTMAQTEYDENES